MTPGAGGITHMPKMRALRTVHLYIDLYMLTTAAIINSAYYGSSHLLSDQGNFWGAGKPGTLVVPG